MALRPGRTVRRLERPYTRVSERNPNKSYVKGVPFPKIHQFEMGNKGYSFETSLYLVSKASGQIRENALEAGRIIAHKFLEKKLGNQNYFLKILKYPHHVLREKPIATGAGADRYSRGMAQAFGKPVGRAVRILKDEKLVEVRINKDKIREAKEALRRFASKLSVPFRISS